LTSKISPESGVLPQFASYKWFVGEPYELKPLGAVQECRQVQTQKFLSLSVVVHARFNQALFAYLPCDTERRAVRLHWIVAGLWARLVAAGVPRGSCLAKSWHV
jgi:hypothetical protein